MKPWLSRRRRSRSKPYDPVLDSQVGVRWRKRSAAVGEALRGISADLAVLDWDWHPDREPRPTKLMIRDQMRINSLRELRRESGMKFRQFFWFEDVIRPGDEGHTPILRSGRPSKVTDYGPHPDGAPYDRPITVTFDRA